MHFSLLSSTHTRTHAAAALDLPPDDARDNARGAPVESHKKDSHGRGRGSPVLTNSSCWIRRGGSFASAAEFCQRHALDLPDALLRQPEPLRQLVVRRRRRFSQAEVAADDVALARIKPLEQLRN